MGEAREDRLDDARSDGDRQAAGSPVTMRELHGALTRGDEAALAALLPPLRARLLLVAKSRVRESEADEVVQETLTTLWQKRAAVHRAESLLPFVLQVLTNKIGNSYRREQRQRAQAADVAASVAAGARPAHPGAQLDERELHCSVEEAIQKCAREHPTWGRLLELLRAGRSAPEIRAELGDATLPTVHVRLHRVRQRLKEILLVDHGIEIGGGRERG